MNFVTRALAKVGEVWSTVRVDGDLKGTVLEGWDDGTRPTLGVRLGPKWLRLPRVTPTRVCRLYDSRGTPQCVAAVLPDWAARLNSWLAVHVDPGAGSERFAVKALLGALVAACFRLLRDRVYRVSTGPGLQAPLLGGDDFTPRGRVSISEAMASEFAEEILGGALFVDDPQSHEQRAALALLKRLPSRLRTAFAEKIRTRDRAGARALVGTYRTEVLGAMNGMEVWFLRYPVGSGTGVSRYHLQVVRGCADRCLFVNTRDIKERHQGDYDGDFGYILLSPDNALAPPPALVAYALNLRVRAEAVPLSVQGPLPAHPEPVRALIGMDQKSLVGVYTWRAWVLARTVAWVLTFRSCPELRSQWADIHAQDQHGPVLQRMAQMVLGSHPGLLVAARDALPGTPAEEAYRATFNVVIQLLETAFDARKSDAGGEVGLGVAVINMFQGTCAVPVQALRASGVFTEADVTLLSGIAWLQTGTDRMNADCPLVGPAAHPFFDAIVARRGRGQEGEDGSGHAATDLLKWAIRRGIPDLYEAAWRDLMGNVVHFDLGWLRVRPQRRPARRLVEVRPESLPFTASPGRDVTSRLKWTVADALEWLIAMGVPLRPLARCARLPAPAGWSPKYRLEIEPRPGYVAYLETPSVRALPEGRVGERHDFRSAPPPAPMGLIVERRGARKYCPVSLHHTRCDGARRIRLGPHVEPGEGARLSPGLDVDEVAEALSAPGWTVASYWWRWALAVLAAYQEYAEHNASIDPVTGEDAVYVRIGLLQSYLDGAVDQLGDSLKEQESFSQLYCLAHEIECVWQPYERGRLALDADLAMKVCFWKQAGSLGFDMLQTSKSRPGVSGAWVGTRRRSAWLGALSPLADAGCLRRTLRELRSAMPQAQTYTHPERGRLRVTTPGGLPSPFANQVIEALTWFVDLEGLVPDGVNADQLGVTLDGEARFEATCWRSKLIDEAPAGTAADQAAHAREVLGDVPITPAQLENPDVSWRSVAGFWMRQFRYRWQERRPGDGVYKIVLADAVKGMTRPLGERFVAFLGGEHVPIHLVASAQAVRDKDAQAAVLRAVLSTLPPEDGGPAWVIPDDASRAWVDTTLRAKIAAGLARAGRDETGRVPVYRVAPDGRLLPMGEHIVGWQVCLRTPHDDVVSTKARDIKLSINDRLIGGVPFCPSERDRDEVGRFFDLVKGAFGLRPRDEEGSPEYRTPDPGDDQ